jgi:hypothetical protein
MALSRRVLMSIRAALLPLFAAACFFAIAGGAGAKLDAVESGCMAAARTLASAASPRNFDDYIGDTRGPDICGQNTRRTTTKERSRSACTSTIAATSPPKRRTASSSTQTRTPRPAASAPSTAFDSPATAPYSGSGTAHGSRRSRRGRPPSGSPATDRCFQVKTSDIGGAQGFKFSFFSTDGVNVDLAPNAGAWSYQLAPLQLSVRRLVLDRAKAGRPFSAHLAVVRSDLDQPLSEGEISCAAKLGAKALVGAGSFAAGQVVCTWGLPKKTRNKPVTGTVAVHSSLIFGSSIP